ncbi:MAG: SDR family NAD(P)-dependent oxidoreductase [Halobacteriales archaeon]
MRVFITGGANGIGRAAALRLLREDHEVLVLDTDEDGLRELPEAVETYRGDIRDRARVRDVIDGETFDVLVNNAGFSASGAIEDMEAEELRRHFETNVYGHLHAIDAALPMLREQEGRIVNVTSVMSHITVPYWGVYCASKHALKALSHELRTEVEPSDVEVVIVEPGRIGTGFNERARDNVERYLPDSRHSEGYREKLNAPAAGGKPAGKAGTVVATAATTARPRARYRVGIDAWLVPKLRVLLPDRLWDRLVTRFT